MKTRTYQSCVSSAVLYGSGIWCLREDETAIFKRTEKAMIRATSDVKLIEKSSSQELMDFLGSEKTLDRLAKANKV